MRPIMQARQSCQARMPTVDRSIQSLRPSLIGRSTSCRASAAATYGQQQQQEQQQQHIMQSEQQPQQDKKPPSSKIPLDSFINPTKSPKKPSSSSGGGSDPEDPPPSGPNLPPQIRQLLALLTEFGGKLGTAAVLIAWLTNIDPFGNLHWDQADVQFGLLTFLPLMLFDASLMLPDYSISDPQEQRAVTGMFVGEPQILNMPPKDTPTPNTSSSSSGTAGDAVSTASSSSSSSEVSDAEARRMADALEAAAASADPGAPIVIMQQQQQPDGQPGSTTTSSSSSLDPLLRLRVSLGLLQQVYTRANPGIGLSPAAEAVVVLVATLADEMLYRAVALTLLGLWLRDRLFEAGFDDDVTLQWLAPLTGQQPLQMPTSEYSQYLAVAVVATLGIAGFAVGALREIQTLQKMQVIDKDGNASSPAAQALKSQLVSNLGTQNVTLYAVEGLREVTASIMAGLAFVTTHNLAAPLAGSVAVQTLFSLYQRLSLDRVRSKRQALREKVMQRQQKLEAAMQAALAAKKAQEAADAAAAATAAAAEAGATAEQQAGGGSEQQQGEEEVDFLTAVLRAAEQQQAQQKQQKQQQAVASSSSSIADSTPANWLSGTPDGASSTSSSSSNGVEAAGVVAGSGAAAAAAAAASPEVAQQQLAALLEDMLRSPEGNRIVQAWMDRQDSSMRDSFALNRSSSSPQEAVEKLLADPAIKAQLLAELQEQLVGLSEATAKQQQQLEKAWRRKL